MTALIPSSFLFRYTLDAGRLPRYSAKALRPLDDSFVCFLPADLNTKEKEEGATPKPHYDFRAAWHEKGLVVAVNVSGRSHPAEGDSRKAAGGDELRIWLNTRPGTDSQRPTRHCRCWTVTPGDRAFRGHTSVIAKSLSGQDMPLVPSGAPELVAVTEQRENGHQITVRIPAEHLEGYREVVEETRTVGFYAILNDSEFGALPLSVSSEFQVEYNPSLWATLRFTD